jgi:hypothetical protein
VGYSTAVVASPFMLLVLPAIVAAVPLLLWEPRGWPQMAARLGIIGLGLCAWIDIVDNVGDIENDPPLLSAAWALSAALVATGRLTTLLRRRRRQ